jgi:two-component system, NarL family, invasion response regulator UvrY
MPRETVSSRSPPGDSSPVSVLTVDDQEVFRAAAREVIDATPGFEALGEAASGEEALALLERLDFQLVLVDLRMPGMGGVEAARRIKEMRPGAVVVLVSLEEPQDVPATAWGSGAVAFVRKQEFAPTMLRRLWLIHGPA